MPLGAYLRSHAGVSAHMLKRLKNVPDGMTRNGAHIRSIDPVRSGDVIRLHFPETATQQPNPALSVPVVYESAQILVCDKPAGIKAEDAADMCRAAEEHRVLFAMMFQQRTFPKYRTIKKILEEGQLGTIRRMFMETTRYFRTEYYHASGSWRSSWSGEGGGLLINQAQHPLDVWQFLFGLPETVYAEIPFGKYNSFTVDDEATIVMRYADGVTGTFIASTGEAEWSERLSISGSKGKLVLTDNTLEVSMYSADSDEYRKTAKVTDGRELSITRTEEKFGPDDSGLAYVSMLKNFASAVLDGTELIAPGTAGEGALELMCASYLSAWKMARVSLPVDREEYREYLRKAVAADMNM